MKGVARSVSIATAALAGVLYVYENLAYLQVLHSLPTGLAAVTALQTEHLAMSGSMCCVDTAKTFAKPCHSSKQAYLKLFFADASCRVKFDDVVIDVFIPLRICVVVRSSVLRNAFYYSYFQELVDVEHIGVGLYRIIWDHRTEYPDVLNAIRRFNIYQDTAFGTLCCPVT